MSLDINPEKITEVLLADGWHTVDDGSFNIDAYEINDASGGDGMILPGGAADGVTATGFSFVTDEGSGPEEFKIMGPLTSVLAVKVRETW